MDPGAGGVGVAGRIGTLDKGGKGVMGPIGRFGRILPRNEGGGVDGGETALTRYGSRNAKIGAAMRRGSVFGVGTVTLGIGVATVLGPFSLAHPALRRTSKPTHGKKERIIGLYVFWCL